MDEPDVLDPACSNCAALRKNTDPKANPRIVHHDDGHHDDGHHTVTPREQP